MESTESNPSEPGSDLSKWVTTYLPVAAVVLYFGALAATPPLGSRWLDFPVYWEAGQKAVQGSSVYDVAGHFQYKYSPLVALLFGKAFWAFDFETASWVFQKTMLALWALNIWKILGPRPVAIALFLLFFGNALRLDLALGQMNAVVFYLLLLLFSMAERPASVSHDLRFGFVFSLAVQMKLFALVVVPFLVFRREWRKLAFGILLLPILSVGGLVIDHGLTYAMGENQAWLRSLATSTDELIVAAQNVGLLGVLTRAMPGGGLAFAKTFWLLGGGAFLYYLWERRERSTEYLRNQLLFVIAVFNPLVWSYWILFAFPLAVAAARNWREQWESRSVRLRIFVVLEFVRIFAAFNGQHARWAWAGGILLGLILIWDLASRERKSA